MESPSSPALHRPASTTPTRRRRAAAGLAVVAILMGLSTTRGARAAMPPTLVNYQGVLRDQNDKPLGGTYDMTFRFMDADTAGSEILVEQHVAATANAVTVTGGLFSVALGSGTMTDGSGAGTYTSLDTVFRDYGGVWLEVKVGAETLSPRTRIQSAPYALNASSAVNATQLNGQPAGNFIDTSNAEQSKHGTLDLLSTDDYHSSLEAEASGVYSTGVHAVGDANGVWATSNHNAAYLEGGDYGVRASGTNYAGGLFQGLGASSYGVWASSPYEGGRFENTGSYAPVADLARGNTGAAGTCGATGGIGLSGVGERTGVFGSASGASAPGAMGGSFIAGGASSLGIQAAGTTGGRFSTPGAFGAFVDVASAAGGVSTTGFTNYGGYFQTTGSSSTGVFATGTTGGRFTCPGAPGGEVDIAGPGGGIVSTGFGNFGGKFQTAGAGSTGAYASGDDKGIDATGGNYGGRFQGSNAGAYGVYGSGASGVVGSGTSYGVHGTGSTAGGVFDNPGGPSATLATGTMGISASGTTSGGYLSNNSPWYSYAYIPYQGDGVLGYGAYAGGEFRSFGTSSYAYIGYSTYKIYGNGAVAFVQNHPDDPSKVIVYNAPEGDEVAVYTRGAGRLLNGEARVALGGTFALVTNPDVGLTATVTPRGEPIPLAVSEVSPGELVVRGPAGSDASFDYMVWGLRIGFEEQSIVQPKRSESKIPSMQEHEKVFADEPALRGYTALARYKGVEEAARGRKSIDFSRTDRLKSAIGVFAPGDASALPASAPGRPAGAPEPPAVAASERGGARIPGDGSSAPSQPASGAGGGSGTGGRDTGGVALPPAAGGLDPAAARWPAPGLDLFAADGRVETGDVVSLGTGEPGSIVRSSGPSDTLVIGCAQLREPASARVAVATSHVALCRVDAAFGAIEIGDRLTPSPTPGAAMKVDPAAAGTAILGRAIEALDSGTGLVRVLLGAR